MSKWTDGLTSLSVREVGGQEDGYHGDRIVNTVMIRRTTGNSRQKERENERYRDRQGVGEK